mmetsp:Transcript_22000/g.68020  ORF Transcript_22000/g.68020 Transcript_22000/m.68020 type:complete len:260 (+) Transcript_22000:1034-1813(+)
MHDPVPGTHPLDVPVALARSHRPAYGRLSLVLQVVWRDDPGAGHAVRQQHDYEHQRAVARTGKLQPGRAGRYRCGRAARQGSTAGGVHLGVKPLLVAGLWRAVYGGAAHAARAGQAGHRRGGAGRLAALFRGQAAQVHHVQARRPLQRRRGAPGPYARADGVERAYRRFSGGHFAGEGPAHAIPARLVPRGVCSAAAGAARGAVVLGGCGPRTQDGQRRRYQRDVQSEYARGGPLCAGAAPGGLRQRQVLRRGSRKGRA